MSTHSLLFLLVHLASSSFTASVHHGNSTLQAADASKLPLLGNNWNLNIGNLDPDIGNSDVWGTSISRDQLGRMALAADPSAGAGAGTGPVVQVTYPAGSWTPGSSNPGGTSFFAAILSPGAATAILSYEVFFAPNFDFNKGGKLPGLAGADTRAALPGCQGGMHSDACFSLRLMWRAHGAGEAYAYLPTRSSALCRTRSVYCNDDYGVSLSRGALRFQTGRWHAIQIMTQMNTPGKDNGILSVYVDGVQSIHYSNIQYTTAQSGQGVTSMFWSTFFGGATQDWASPTNTYTMFKGINLAYQAQPAVQDSRSSRLGPQAPLVVLLIATLTCFSAV
ncbi:hypothetical protein SeMB42_g03221 [Synchytrium endobioticum]|uniref:Polysaccharide lyase 14 domain-containing protein n=1 Tax=Synchytrium endobioticum TaxID=286115 RepID=A0A507D2V6_9FUNG|nr:hypothetical protein SeLEV6574_g03609 [Synchytrium endobioticum]TPX47717.1 hypothetical protein SeMB42_g03221 [Synchytrium endobioticum]